MILSETYSSPYLGIAEDLMAEQTFSGDLANGEINIEAFHKAYDSELEKLGVFNTQTGSYNGRNYTYEVFNDDGTLKAKKVYGIIAQLKADPATKKNKAVRALSALWAATFVDNKPTTELISPNTVTSTPITTQTTYAELVKELDADDNFLELVKRLQLHTKTTEDIAKVYIKDLTAVTTTKAKDYIIYSLFLAVVARMFEDKYKDKKNSLVIHDLRNSRIDKLTLRDVVTSIDPAGGEQVITLKFDNPSNNFYRIFDTINVELWCVDFARFVKEESYLDNKILFRILAPTGDTYEPWSHMAYKASTIKDILALDKIKDYIEKNLPEKL